MWNLNTILNLNMKPSWSVKLNHVKYKIILKWWQLWHIVQEILKPFWIIIGEMWKLGKSQIGTFLLQDRRMIMKSWIMLLIHHASCWFAGPLFWSFAGPLSCWFAGPLSCWSISFFSSAISFFSVWILLSMSAAGSGSCLNASKLLSFFWRFFNICKK